jgi:hypothetical protein
MCFLALLLTLWATTQAPDAHAVAGVKQAMARDLHAGQPISEPDDAGPVDAGRHRSSSFESDDDDEDTDTETALPGGPIASPDLDLVLHLCAQADRSLDRTLPVLTPLRR